MIVETWIYFILWCTISTMVIVKCSKKKPAEPKVPNYKMSTGGPKSNKVNNGGGNNAQAPTNSNFKGNDKKDGGAVVAAAAAKPGKDGPPAPAKAAPANGGIIPGLNRDHLVGPVKDAAPTIRKSEGGDGKKVVSNPIVSAATDKFPTMAQPVNENIKTDKTQISAVTDRTQKG